MLRLRRERLRRGLSQTALARLAGIDRGNLSRVENGLMYCPPAWRRRLAEALGWPVERALELLEEVVEDEPQAQP